MRTRTERGNFALDNSLRNVVYSLMEHNEVRFLGIEFTHRGKRWRVDTVDEAVALRQRLEREDYDAAKADPKIHRKLLRAQAVWTADRFWDLLNGIGESQKRLLEALMGKREVDSTQLVKGLGLGSQIALAGVLSGLSKQLRSMGLSPTELYRVDTSWRENKRVRRFTLMPEFELAAQDAGWPEAWREKGVTDAASTKRERKL